MFRRNGYIQMSLESSVACVERALSNNPRCCTGLMANKRAFGVPYGPSGGPEILTMLYIDDPSFGYWYGHVMRHPANEQVFVAMIVWATQFINAQSVPLLFRRFHYWGKDRLYYQPCSIQNVDDAYCEADTLEKSARNLSSMIARFDLEKRRGHEDGPYAISPEDMRILNVYGLEDTRDENGIYPPVPMNRNLTVVKSKT